VRVKYFQAATPARKVLAAPHKHKAIFQSNADQNCWLFRNSVLPLYSCQTLPARHKDLLMAVPPYYSQRFCTARQTFVRDTASLANVMAVDGAKHGVRGGKSLPATGLAMSPIPALVKRPRFKTPRAHVCDHAPENTQNRAARCCYATHSRLTSPQRPFSSAYMPYLPISSTILRHSSKECSQKTWRGTKRKNPVPLTLLDHSFPYCVFKEGVAFSKWGRCKIDF